MGFFKKLFGKKEPEKIVYAGRATSTANSNERAVPRQSDNKKDKSEHQSATGNKPGSSMESEMVSIRNKVASMGKTLGLGVESERICTIPELAQEQSNVVMRLCMEFEKLDILKPELYAAWAFFAGVAATALWNSNWADMKRQGVTNHIMDQRGFDCLDEWVLEEVWGYDDVIPDETHPVGHNVQILGLMAFTEVMQHNFGSKADIRGMQRYIYISMLVMYNYGIEYQMGKLGMK